MQLKIFLLYPNGNPKCVLESLKRVRLPLALTQITVQHIFSGKFLQTLSKRTVKVLYKMSTKTEENVDPIRLFFPFFLPSIISYVHEVEVMVL